jgi:hypothetical protein
VESCVCDLFVVGWVLETVSWEVEAWMVLEKYVCGVEASAFEKRELFCREMRSLYTSFLRYCWWLSFCWCMVIG